MLVLEAAGPEILAHYVPPDAGPSVGGYLGRVFPGGSFLGLSYELLLALGAGSHTVVADERAEDEEGEDTRRLTEDDQRSRELRWALFMYRVGACTEGDVLCRALLAMTPGNVARAALLLPEEWQLRLRDLVAEIPVFRARGGYRFVSNVGVTQIPDDNLVAVERWFGGRAELGSAPDPAT